MRNTLLAIAAASMTVTGVSAVSAAWTPAEAKGAKHRRYHSSANGVRYWRGDDGRYYCKRSNGTTGMIVGAAGGALAGRAIDTRGERATGTILGAAAGALLGREVQRSMSCR
jgi:outer membrane lipoprotein SlyB